MSITTENILLIGSILLFISILAGKTSYRFGVPTLLFFLLIGMLAGSEGIGRIEFNDPGLAQFIGIVALNFILFSGGFDTVEGINAFYGRCASNGSCDRLVRPSDYGIPDPGSTSPGFYRFINRCSSSIFDTEGKEYRSQGQPEIDTGA